MANELQRLTHVHQAMVELALQGLPRNEIAKLMNRTPESVGMVINSPLFQAELARRRGEQTAKTDDVQVLGKAEAGRILEENAANAATRMVDLLGSSDEKIALQSAKDILDRTYGKGASEQNPASVTVLNVEKMQMLVQTIREARAIREGSSAQTA